MAEEESPMPENVPEMESVPLRENLVTTAVNFLQNPKVQGSPLNQKKEFLKKKGLTDEEIQAAVERSGSTDVISQTLATPSETTLPYAPGIQQVVVQKPTSTWSRIRDYSALTIIIGGVVYGLYMLFKKYIEPFFMKRHEKLDKKLSKLEEGIFEINNDMKKNLQELQISINDLRQQFTDQNLKMTQVSNNLALYKAESSGSGASDTSINDLKSDIASIKGLLLSTKQFPATPVNPPVIPSWQMKESINELEKNETNSENLSKKSQDSQAQKRIDLEENEPDFEKTDSNTDESPKINGHSTEQNSENESNTVQKFANGIATNLHNSILVSPDKLAALRPANVEPCETVEGEFEVD